MMLHARFAWLVPLCRHLLVLLTIVTLAAATARASTVDDDLPQVYTVTPTGVNLQTGAYMYSKTDLSIGPLTFVRSWGMVPAFKRTETDNYDQQSFGAWNHNYGFGVRAENILNRPFTYVYIDGRRLQFTYDTITSSFTPFSLESHGTLLTVANQKFVFTDRSGNIYYFTGNPGAQDYLTGQSGQPGAQVIDHVDYADGRRLSFFYDNLAHPIMISSNLGYALLLKYSGNLLTTVCGFNTAVQYVTSATNCTGAAVQVSYTYIHDSFGGLLSTVTDARNAVTNLSYQSNGSIRNLTCISLPNVSTCEITNIYGALPGDSAPIEPNQVRRQTRATGGIWNYEYHPPDPDDPLVGHHLQNSSAKMTDPYGGVTYARYYGGLLTSLITPGGMKTLYEFSGVELRKVEYPEGNSDTRYEDTRQNITNRTLAAKPGSGLPDIVSTATYPASNSAYPVTGCIAASQKLCNKPITVTDPRNNQTSFTYDPAHGGVLTQTDPADANGIQPVKRRLYVQRYAWVKNASGTYSQAVTPIWLPSQERTCRTTATTGSTCAGGASDEVLTSYEYGADTGPNNLLLRGQSITADGQTLRTCFGYDPIGNRISETAPRAGLATCP